MIQGATGERARGGAGFRGFAHGRASATRDLHPAWRAFIAYCEGLEHGEIDRLKIQDGLPQVAELTRKKVKFT